MHLKNVNLKYLFIVVLLAVLVGAGIFIYSWKISKESSSFDARTPGESKQDQAKGQELQWACGSLHTHIMIFEDERQNTESLEEVIAASEKLGFKFIMLSEKGPSYSKDSPNWKNMIRDCDKNNTNDFVCLSGQENCTLEEAPKKPRGHFVIIENKDYIPEILDVPEVLGEAHKQGSVVIIAHPFYKEDISDMYNYNRWDILDWEAMEVIDGVIDQESNEKALKKIYEFWNKGIKKSLTGGADFKNHKAYTNTLLDPKEVEDKLKTGYTCLYLNALNREAIIKAIKNGNGYASSGVQINDFTVNGARMGETVLVPPNGSLSIKIDAKAGSKIKKVVLIENGNVSKVFQPTAPEFVKDFSLPVRESGWYNLEVYAEDGRAFTNAIWVEVR
ncbi:MAG: CehA/McbA family metallohydrolase [Candidatus Doudnabacteria bacterium]